MQDRDTLQLLRAYRKEEVPLTAHPLTDEMVWYNIVFDYFVIWKKSRMLPREFEEKSVRLYCKDSKKMESLKKLVIKTIVFSFISYCRLFKEWCKENNLTDGITTSKFNVESFLKDET